MSTKRLALVSTAAVAFVMFQAWTVYDEPSGANDVWAGFSLICLLWVASLWLESLRKR